MKQFTWTAAWLSFFFLLTSFDPENLTYNEQYRPQFHFSPEKNFMGSPSGLVYYEGQYHLFYQYNPSGLKDTLLHWGHAVSADLIRWEHLPVSIFPEKTDAGFCPALPGSIIVDENNLLKRQSANHKTLVVFYTAGGCGQRLAYSTDGGEKWMPYEEKLSIPEEGNLKSSYPRVFWYQPGNKWAMALFCIPGGDERKKGFSFFTSTDLLNWEFQSHLAGFSDSPDLVEMKVNNRPDDMRWLIFEGNGNYVIGSFDGAKFIPESIRLSSDFGKNFHAPMVWQNVPSTDGRVLQIASVQDGQWPGMPFSGQMTFPSELSLKTTIAGIILVRQPAREIEKLCNKPLSWKNEILIPGINKNLIKKIEGDCLRIKGSFHLKSCESFGLMLRAGKKSPGAEIVYNVKRQTLSVLGQNVVIEPLDGRIILELLIDRSSVEVYVNNGRAVFTNNFINQPGDMSYILFNTGGELLVEDLNVWPVKSAWIEEKK